MKTHLPICVERDLTESILGSCFEVMNIMGSGFLENVYIPDLLVEDKVIEMLFYPAYP